MTVIFVMAGIGAVRFGAFSRTELQLLLTPVIVLLFSRISIAGVRVPRSALVCTLVAAVCGAAVMSIGSMLQDGRLVITSLSDDLLGSDAHVTRDQMQRLVAPEDKDLLVATPRKVESESDAERFLKSDSRAGGVVWGTKRWTYVSLRSYPPQSLAEILGTAAVQASSPRLQKLAGLKIVRGIPLIGLSGVSGSGTFQFIGELAANWRDFPLSLSAEHADLPFESRIRALGGIKAPWTSPAHLALPAWMVGTYHAVQAMHGLYNEDYQAGEFGCAKRSLQRALLYLRPGDNPALEAAILNNLGVVQIMEAEMSSQPKKGRLMAIRYMRQAAVLLKSYPGTSSAVRMGESAVQDNLALLVPAGKKRR
jgi:hypothetical protein